MPKGRQGRHRCILLLATCSLAQASTACATPYRDIGAPGPADVTGTGSIGGDGIYVTTGGAVLDAGGVYLLLPF